MYLVSFSVAKKRKSPQILSKSAKKLSKSAKSLFEGIFIADYFGILVIFASKN